MSTNMDDDIIINGRSSEEPSEALSVNAVSLHR